MLLKPHILGIILGGKCFNSENRKKYVATKFFPFALFLCMFVERWGGGVVCYIKAKIIGHK